MKAYKDGECKACGQPIEIGDEIKCRYKTWIHSKCPDIEAAKEWFNMKAEARGYEHVQTARGTYRRVN